MSKYTVRIELHSSTYSPDFTTLHRAMNSEGFSKLITGNLSKTYHLPRGEYNIETSLNRSQVLRKAEKAVESTGKTVEILVTESSGRTWSGLKRKSNLLSKIKII